MEIKVKIDAPELATAINSLAQAIGKTGKSEIPAGQWVPGGGEIEEDPATKPETPKADTTAKEEPAKDEPKHDNAISLETVRVKLAELAQSGKQKEVKELITSLGAEKLSDIPAEKYSELLEKAAEI